MHTAINLLHIEVDDEPLARESILHLVIETLTANIRNTER